MISKEQEDNLFKHLLDLFKPFEQMAQEMGERELSAIWLTDPVPTIDGKKHCRFETGNRIRIIENNIMDGESNATVNSCFGTLTSSSLKMLVLMDTGEPLIITIK